MYAEGCGYSGDDSNVEDQPLEEALVATERLARFFRKLEEELGSAQCSSTAH
jgi:hypothetical protein